MSRHYLEVSKNRWGVWNIEDAVTRFYEDFEAEKLQEEISSPKPEKSEELDDCFDLEFFIRNGDAGLYQIAIEIFSNLSLQELKKMREVNKTIEKFIEKERIFSRLIKKPMLFRHENLTSRDLEEYERWIEFLNRVKNEGSVHEICYFIPINRKYICIGDDFVPLSPLKVAIVLESKKLLMMIQRLDLLVLEEKPEWTERFTNFVSKASTWARKDNEVNSLLFPTQITSVIQLTLHTD